MEYTGLSAAIAGYIDERRRVKKEPVEKSCEKALKEEPEAARRVAISTEYQAQLQALDNQFSYIPWLTDAAKRAKQISLVTHAPKFTHGDAKGSGVLDDRESTVAKGYLSTLVLSQPEIDTIGNAAAANSATLLLLTVDDISVADCIAQDDISPFTPFTDDPQLLGEWLAGFKLALVDKDPSSHPLAKQIFFPVAEQKYHLLSPLFPSSLAHEIYARIGQSRFGEQAKEIREAKKAGKYHAELQVSYPGTAIQIYGGSKPLNISSLNVARGGKMLLLSCAPPSWRGRLTPPSGKDILYSSEFNRRTWQQVNQLKSYLLSVAEKESTLEIRQQRGRYVVALVDALLNYATEIQSLTELAGWSSHPDCKLPDAQKIWLDPHHPSAEFQQQRSKNAWPGEIAKQFAHWLNKKLEHKRMTFALAESQAWQKIFSQRLWAFDLGRREEV
ncbi:CRISPR-associated protein%2C Csy1 family [Yersinia rohdei]|uniref:type I-F CRISPR-associated protein Csy1 n=1 Tax=Yersinia rohdei TaxID=29485 RepID=UPI0005E16C20|nr:type I-F CRISPR-associated protein Csy1 [Yersinia rohdei]CNJ47402.1 CRISPR-associated protein%2C Csy1 family [Yersinia rohdei]